jgi:hypothetical protein
MTPWEIKLLNGEMSFLQHLDGFIDNHPVFVTLAILYLLLAFLVLVIVSVARRRDRGLIQPGQHIIYIPPSTPPPPPEEPPFDPSPSRQQLEDEYERLIDPDYRDD